MSEERLREVGETSRGYKLYVEDNEAGGHRYWSDEIGGGVMVWDTCLGSIETLELAIKVEKAACATEPSAS